MIDLKDYVNPVKIAMYVKQLPVEDTLDKTLFPNKKVDGTEFEMAKGAKKKAIALRQSAFDTRAKLRSLNAKVDTNTKEIPFFKEGITVNEKDKRKLMDLKAAGSDDRANFVLNEIYKGHAELVEAAEIVAKGMRAQVIQNGTIVYSSNPADGNVIVDYGVPSNHKITLTGTDKWTDPSADIYDDIVAYKKILTDEHYAAPNTMLMTEVTFMNTIMKNTTITNDIKNSNLNTTRILAESDYLTFLKERLKMSVVFEETVTYCPYKGASEVPYYDDYKVTFINSTNLGDTLYGVTPEEYDLSTRNNKYPTVIYDNRIAISTEEIFDPCTTNTKVSVMPIVSFDKADEVFFATVG
ncbi:phage capsid protein [Clostridium gelidum]|uniref:Phage capsid protein n=1 Tax=Clostridium gelidum TaxID=704125 RepID=A0ABM7T4P3_9CLOT|nr:major capsid protein [Clostridium gelidum]BCZ46945.1 phage capsid protein [Clostridium gelidum]